MKKHIKKAIGKAKTAAKVTGEVVQEFIEGDSAFCLVMKALLGFQAIWAIGTIISQNATDHLIETLERK